jgi:4-alpha-glucanotransferase
MTLAIDDSYEDAFGRRRAVSEETRARLLAAMQLGAGEEEPPGTMRFVREGERGLAGGATIVLEDGSERRVEGEIPLDLPPGYHTLHEDGAEAVPLVASPRACPLPERSWGLAVQLYAARTRASWGMGDLGDLRDLARWSKGELGAAALLLNPLAAPLPVAYAQGSPYFASTRRWRSPLYLRVEEVDGAAACDLDGLARAGRELNRGDSVDRAAIARLKLEALERIFAARGADDELERWRVAQGPSLEHFARFCTLSERFGSGWRGFPLAYRRCEGAEVEAFAAEHAERVRFHAWLQWQLDRQLACAAGEIALVHDLPIGFDSDGADGWAYQDLLALDVAIGAPPDPFNDRGQDWGLPPFIPWKLRAAGYRPFIETLRAGFAHAGGLRIDHVMGLFRLFWVPRGMHAAEGAYVRYPADDLLDLLVLEAHRAGAFVVGEDLGTVPPGVREILQARNVLSYRLLWFEDAPPAAWPERAMAAVTTHDLPTIAGLWSGADRDDQRRWGFEPAPDDDVRRRLERHARIDEGAPVADAVRGAYAALADAPSRIAVVSLEDALLVPLRPNLPGSIERPNWCHPLPVALEDLPQSELLADVARVLRGR